MIKITKEGKKMLETTFGSKGQTKFKIQHIKPTCNACRDELRLVPGSSEPNDVISMESGYVFFVDKDLMQLAEIITIDAAGDIPVLTTRKSIDVRERSF